MMCDSNTLCDSINVNVEIKDSITNSNRSDNDSVLKTIRIRSYIIGDLFRGCPLNDRVIPMSGPGLGHGGYGRPRDKVEFYHGQVGHECDVIGMQESFIDALPY